MKNTSFESIYLADIVSRVKDMGAKPGFAYTMHPMKNTWEFFYGDFYWYGRAENSIHAKCKGWDAWIAKQQEPCR